jgi:hypothetical protein
LLYSYLWEIWFTQHYLETSENKEESHIPLQITSIFVPNLILNAHKFQVVMFVLNGCTNMHKELAIKKFW